MLIPESKADDKPVASLLSRIGGLSTEDTEKSSAPAPTQPAQQPPTAPASRPKPNTSNPLFGRALASVKSDRVVNKPKETAPAPAEEPKGDSARGKELLGGTTEDKPKMASENLIDTNGMFGTH